MCTCTDKPAASSVARMKATVEPLPFVPPTWMTGGKRRCGIAERGQQALEPSERQVQLARMQIEETLQHDIR